MSVEQPALPDGSGQCTVRSSSPFAKRLRTKEKCSEKVEENRVDSELPHEMRLSGRLAALLPLPCLQAQLEPRLWRCKAPGDDTIRAVGPLSLRLFLF